MDLYLTDTDVAIFSFVIGGVLLLIVIPCIVWYAHTIIYVKKNKEKKTKERIAALKEQREKERRKKEKLQAEEEKKIRDLEELYGKRLKYYGPLNIQVFEKDAIFIQNKMYAFSDIIGYELKDDGNAINTGGTISPSTSGTIGRALAGSLVGGGTGAIVGAMTAGRKIDTISTKTHRYILYIKVQDLKSPVIRLHIGNDRDLAMEIAATLDIICLRQKSN